MTVEVEFQPNAKSSLGGMRVLDLSRLVSGNIVTHLLADHGAEVIKVERPGTGDDLRNWKTKGHSVHWKVYCRNKKSITLNARVPEGQRSPRSVLQGPSGGLDARSPASGVTASPSRSPESSSSRPFGRVPDRRGTAHPPGEVPCMTTASMTAPYARLVS